MQKKRISRKILEQIIPFYTDFKTVAEEMDVQIYFVGGLIRDLVLKKSSMDIDIVPIGKSYEQVAKALQKRIKCAAIPFKDNYRLVKGDIIVDVSAPRGDSIESDLMMRDFTINNLAMGIDGKIYGQVDDVQNRLIRSVYDQNLDDDPLRILRAFRFISQMGFDLEDSTEKQIAEKKSLIKTVAVERIFDEIKKLVIGTHFEKSLFMLSRMNVLTAIIPELNTLHHIGFSEYHHRDVYDHTVHATIKMHQITKQLHLSEEKSLILITTMLLHDVGKGAPQYADGQQFIEHEAVSMTMAETILIRLNYPKKIMKEVLTLIENHSRLRIYSKNGAKDRTLMKYIFDQHTLLNEHIWVSLADNLVKLHDLTPLREIVLRIRKLEKTMSFHNVALITGKDLMNLGIKPGPEMKTILADVHFQLASNTITDKSDAQKYITDKYSRG